ncbi:unnamed protein product [Effrenium voratum]|nr:unnamed protein product [Effrenium voratum]
MSDLDGSSLGLRESSAGYRWIRSEEDICTRAAHSSFPVPSPCSTCMSAGASDSMRPGESANWYSLWLRPTGAAAELCRRSLLELSTASGSPIWEPHVALLQYIHMDPEEVCRAAQRCAQRAKAVPVKFTGLEMGCDFYRRAYLTAQKTPELTALFSDLAHQLPFATIPDLGEGLQLLDADESRWISCYEPCMALCYGDLTPSPPGDLATPSHANFTARELSVWEHESGDVSCKSWKQIAKIHLGACEAEAKL